MTTADQIAQYKAMQREGWALFAPLATFTTQPAACLVDYAAAELGHQVLDVACGTGVVAITAARRGARVRGVDLSPVLLEEARHNARLAEVSVDFSEADVEQLPFADDSFDVVLSQFGHMFAPRPDIAIQEMLRVLRPGGRIAFATWPPELSVGKMFQLVARYAPPPEGIAPPAAWGDPDVITQRLGSAVMQIEFDRREMGIPALSPQHYRASVELTAAPVAKVINNLAAEPEKLAEFRRALEDIAERWLHGNVVRQGYLLTRAIKH